MPRSQANNRIFPLVAGGTFTGTAESTAAGVAISVSVLVPTDCTLTIQQSYDKVTWFISEQYPITANAHKTVQQAVGLEYFRVILLNDGITQTFCHLISTLSTSLTQNVNIRNLEETRDKVAVWGQDEAEVQHSILTDASGAIIISNPGGGGGSVVTVDNFPEVQTVSVNNFPAYQPSIEVSNFPAIQEVSGTVAVSNITPFSGENTDFAFYPDASNSTVAIYADEQPPTSTSSAGWIYTNTNPQKINWYVYQDISLPQYRVDEMESIYFVITHFTSASQFPYIVFTTMPDGVNDAVPNFAKSILTFAYAGANEPLGQYLFYVSSDPTDSRGALIRPDIPEGSRFPLTFVAGQSTKTLEQASSERIASANISTSTTALTGEYNFLFQQYGIVWNKTSVYLPVNNGKLETNETNSGAISTTLTSLNGKVTACNTGAISGSVSITGTVEEINSTSIYNTLTTLNGKVVACDTGFVGLQPSYGIKSFDATNLIVKRVIATSANNLLSLNYYNDAGSVNFVLVYDLPSASVTVGTTTPIAVFALGKNQGDTIDLHRLLVTTAITLAVSGSYDGTALPHGNGAYLTVSFLSV